MASTPTTHQETGDQMQKANEETNALQAPSGSPPRSHQNWTRQRFQPTCSHMTMTRLYTSNLTCSVCREPSQ